MSECLRENELVSLDRGPFFTLSHDLENICSDKRPPNSGLQTQKKGIKRQSTEWLLKGVYEK